MSRVSLAPEQDAVAHKHMLAEANRPMNQFTGPLFRVLVLYDGRHGTQHTVRIHRVTLSRWCDPPHQPCSQWCTPPPCPPLQRLILNFHHLIDDGGSVGIFFDELYPLYQAMADGRSTEGLLPPKLSYSAYIDRQRFLMCGGGVVEQSAATPPLPFQVVMPLPVGAYAPLPSPLGTSTGTRASAARRCRCPCCACSGRSRRARWTRTA